MEQTNNIQSDAWSVKYIFRDTKLEVSGDVSFVAYLVHVSDLVGLLESLNGALNKGSVARRMHRKFGGKRIYYRGGRALVGLG